MRKLSKLIANALLTLLAVVLIFAILEGLLRLVLGNPSQQNTPYEFNPDYLVSLKPNYTDTFARSSENGGNRITWSTNSLGYRGAELLPDPDQRILVYGDSNVLARFSEEKDTFTAQLQAQLSSQNPDTSIEVINAGLVGAGTDQCVLRMEHELPRLKPDLVILHIFASNDMGDVIRNRLFELDEEGKLVKTDFPLLPDPDFKSETGIKARLKNTRLFALAGRLNRSLTRKGQLDPAAYIQSIDRTNDEEFRVYKERRPLQFSHFADHYDIDIAIRPQAVSSITKVKLLSGLLQKASQICTDNNCRLMVLIQPPVFDLCSNHLFGPKDLSSYQDYRPERLCSVIGQACRDQNIPALDLFPVFSSSQPEQLYFRLNDDHWNDAGQALAARITGDFISQNQLLF